MLIKKNITFSLEIKGKVTKEKTKRPTAIGKYSNPYACDV